MAFNHHAHRALIEDFCNAIEEGRAPVASGDEALATQRLLNDLLSAAD